MRHRCCPPKARVTPPAVAILPYLAERAPERWPLRLEVHRLDRRVDFRFDRPCEPTRAFRRPRLGRQQRCRHRLPAEYPEQAVDTRCTQAERACRHADRRFAQPGRRRKRADHRLTADRLRPGFIRSRMGRLSITNACGAPSRAGITRHSLVFRQPVRGQPLHLRGGHPEAI